MEAYLKSEAKGGSFRFGGFDSDLEDLIWGGISEARVADR